MHRRISPELREYLGAVRHDQFDWQTRLFYAWWEDFVFPHHLSLNSENYQGDDVNDFVSSLGHKHGIPAKVERFCDTSTDTHGMRIFYSPEEDAIRIGMGRTIIHAYELVHEYTHCWLSHAFDLVADRDSINTLTEHGALFLSAYLDNLCDHSGLDIAQARESVSDFHLRCRPFGTVVPILPPLYIAPPQQAVVLAEKWARLDFSVDGPAQREALREIAYIDVPVQARAGK